jgi:hypothetical protein
VLLPRLIVGTDAFVPFIPPGRRPDECTYDRTLDVLQACWDAGIRAIDFSLHEELRHAVKTMRDRHGKDLVVLGNPSWRCGVRLGDVELMDIRPRVLRTLFDRDPDLPRRLEAAPLSHVRRTWWTHIDATTRALTGSDIASLRLDRGYFEQRLRLAVDLSDVILLGADYADYLTLLGRGDILADMFAIASQHAPVATISHFTEHVLSQLDTLPTIGHFVPYGRHTAFFDHERVRAMAQAVRKPILGAFALLQGPRPVHSLDDLLAFTLSSFPDAALLVGVSDPSHPHLLVEACTRLSISPTR